MDTGHQDNSRLPKRKAVVWIICLALLVTVVVGLGIYYRHPASAADTKADVRGGGGKRRFNFEDKPAVVSIETVAQQDFPVYLNGLGTVTTLGAVTVRPRVDGELIRVAFEEGQLVKAGDVLAEVDPRPLAIALQQAEGQLLRDEALLNNAEQDLTRYQNLLAQDSIADQQVKTQEAQLKQYKGTVAMDRAKVNNAKLQLSYTRLTAPISGRVGLRQIDQGNIVHANDAKGLVVITQMQPISVIFTLPEDKIQTVIQRWRSHQTVKVTAYDRAGKVKLAEGSLQAIDNQIDASTGTLKLKAVFDNQDLRLFANQFVNIKMQLETLSNVALVSNTAIQHDTEGPYVYVVADNKVKVRRVTLGAADADKTVVLDRLALNETVVVEGFDGLSDGGTVDVAQRDGLAVAESPKPAFKAEGKQHRRPKS